MEKLRTLAQLSNYERRVPIDLDQKILDSSHLLQDNFAFGNATIAQDLDKENFRIGIIPRLSPYDIPHLEGTRFVEFPEELVEELIKDRSHDLVRWNEPERFLYRLKFQQKPFEAPIKSNSHALKRLEEEGLVVSFENVRAEPPVPEENPEKDPEKNGRHSRSKIEKTLEINLMGQARIPFALGSVPDVGSFLSYVTMAQAGGMVFMSRDKVLSGINEQATLAKDVIDYLNNTELPSMLYPNEQELLEFAQIMDKPTTDLTKLEDDYIHELRQSWVNNVGAAIEASPRGLERAKSLFEAGCKLYRIYSPEGGMDIIYTVRELRKQFGEKIKIVGGQIMDSDTGLLAEKEGCDAIFIGVAGGSQCTTAVNADIPVNPVHLLNRLRGHINIPIGVEGGGVGTHLIDAFVLGASFLSKPGEIGVSWEGSGGKYIFNARDDENPEYWMPYGGEASVSAKWWKDSLDDREIPKFVEGETGVRRIYHSKLEPAKRNISMTKNLVRLRYMLSVGLVFQRADSIAELHQRDASNLVQVTPEVALLSQPYAR
jgi:hypothetical protein